MEEKEKSVKELEETIEGLKSQNQQLYNALQRAQYGNAFTRLEFLFRVVQFHEQFDAEFLASTVDEIKQIMTIPNEEETTEEKK